MSKTAVQPDCCARKSRLTPLRIALLLGLAVLLATAFWQAHGQDAANAAANAAAPAQPQPVQGRAARLSVVQGQVMVSTEDSPQPEAAMVNLPVVAGNTLETGTDGRAELQFEDGSAIRIVPNSRLQVLTLGGSASGQLETVVDLMSGEGYFDLNPASGDKFTVNALGLNLTSPEPSSFRVNWQAQPEQVAVSDGYVRIRHASDYSVQVNANETLSIDDADVTRYLLSTGTDADPNDAWNEQQEQAEQDADSQLTPAQADGNAEGAADLAEYGNFYDVPGYGQVWQPYGVDDAWGPYDAGYWAWYPFGYVWVSANPWGWLPYRCGYWNYFPGFGWGWIGGAGGGCGIGIWYPIPPWHGRPVGWRPPVRPPWRPIVPKHRFAPLAGQHGPAANPVQWKKVPVGYKPAPVTIEGHTVEPMKPVPPVERAPRPGAAGRTLGSAAPRVAAGAPRYGSRAGNPELGRSSGSNPRSSGGASRPAPAAPHASAPAASHSSSSGSSSGGGHK